ncbi:MAG: ParA family protein [Anaerolineales bacterium]
MTRIFSMVNQKGGVGKTTTSINLGAYLAQFGQRVLLVDLDPQSNATACLGINYREIDAGTYEVLIGEQQAADCILRNQKLGLSLLPSTASLAGAQVELVDMQDREFLLRRSLEPLDGRYDYILVDCPPSLGILTLNGLLAATGGVIIPVQCEYLALEGLSQLMSTIDRVRHGLYPALHIRGLLMTMYDSRTNLAQDVVDEVRNHFSEQVFTAVIPRTVRLAEAPSHGLPISVYAPESTAAVAYRALAIEILGGDGVSIAMPTAEREA